LVKSVAHLVFTMTGACALPGGIATLNLNILRALNRLAEERKMRLTVLSYLEKETDRPDFLPNSVDFQGFCGNRPALVQALFRAAWLRPVYCFDHVTIALPVLPFASIGLVKTVIFAHGSEAWRHVCRTSRWSFATAKLVLANSHFTLRKMQERIPRFNGVACPLGLSPRFPLNEQIPASDSEPFKLPAADGETRPLGNKVLLMVARMHPDEPRKGHYPLLKVWPAVAQEFPDAQLVFAGHGENKPTLERLARESGVGSSIFLVGPVAVELLARLYRRCYGFVMPSKQEGFGLVYLEAMNFGKPCVGCFDDGAEDVIVHDQTGLLVRDPNNAQELLGVLRLLLTEPERARQMGAKGFARLHERFTAAHVQQRVYENIARVL
jgi:glycosyltransferase involved in cell wall biosynthesis